MRKGKYGVCLSFYAVLAFVLALLGQILLCALLLGFVLVAERDDWTSKQVMQAFFLTIFSFVGRALISSINIFREVPFIGDALTVIDNLISSAFLLVILIFVIIAITKVSKGNDASVPVFSKMSNKAFGIVEKKVYTQMEQHTPQA